MNLPTKGNRNSALTFYLSTLVVGAYAMRGFASGDWTGLEFVVGSVGLVKGFSAYRARGEYASSPLIGEGDDE